jgi:hypothetical protein
MMTEMKESEWAEKYQLITNHLTNDGYSYETYGEELEYILLQDNNHIWTEVDTDGGVCIVNGYTLVNRIQYYISVVPWVDGEDIIIPICQYVECSCMDDEGEGNPDCNECGGDGTYTDWWME